MCEKSWNIFNEYDKFEIGKITENLYDDAIRLFTDNFIQQENICIATEVPSSPQAIEELQSLCRKLLQGNVSFAARNIDNGELAAIAINKLMSKQTGNSAVTDTPQNVSPSMQCINDFLHHIEISVDIYNRLQVDCVFEIVFLSTSSEYVQRGLATALFEYSIEYARRLHRGTALTIELPPVEMRALKPSAVCSVFTSAYTQRIGRKLNFEILNKIPYSEFSFQGQTFGERIGHRHLFATFEALRL